MTPQIKELETEQIKSSPYLQLSVCKYLFVQRLARIVPMLVTSALGKYVLQEYCRRLRNK